MAQQQPRPRPRYAGGEIVEVQGGHIVRSTGRKDRHSKVCTAKGPRDRRVRLSAHTAIQFYDVQDRLGYDRPSKAVDWLIKNAKAAIDELAELPAWTPTATPAASASRGRRSVARSDGQPVLNAVGSAGGFGFGEGGSFLPPSLDSDAIADTIKSFFPMAGDAAASSSQCSSPSIRFQSYGTDLISRTSSQQSQDLKLSLQSFQDPIFHASNPQHQASHNHQHNALFAGSSSLSFDWGEQSQRLGEWNVESGGGYVLSVPSQQAVPMQSVLGTGQFLSQRGPLQSSNSPAVRAWAEPVVSQMSNQQMQMQMHPFHHSMTSIGFGSGATFSGFRIPARIQGDEEHEDGLSNKPPSASSASHHR